MFMRSQVQRGPGRRGWWSTVLVLAVFLAVGTTAWLSLVFSSHRSPCVADLHAVQGPPSAFPWQVSTSGSSLSFQPSSFPVNTGSYSSSQSNGTLALRNIVFGIAGSAQLWSKRKEFIKLWWRPQEMRGFVWLEEAVKINPAENLPPVLVSQDTSSFTYTHPLGHPAGIRISRVVCETFRLHLPDVQWFVMGDDDTLFSTDNLVRILSKYDPSEMYYIGSNSESHKQNDHFSHSMAYGGGGFAISYPLAEALARMQDQCLERYPLLFGSDDRLHACITELGVPLTREPGFHQFDIFGNAHGLLAAHPVAPFISMHHLELIDPVFPSLSALDGLHLLVRAMRAEPGSFLQQSICYDHKQGLSFSISSGYVVQVFPEIILPRILTRVEVTFTAWNRDNKALEFGFDTRPAPKSACKKPFLFYMEEIHYEDTRVVSTYKRLRSVDQAKSGAYCWFDGLSPLKVQRIRVVSEPLTRQWYLVPRRQCAKLQGIKDKVLRISVGTCKHGELISTG